MVEPDLHGPKVSLGLAWFTVLAAAAASSELVLAVLLAAMAVLAADEATRRLLYARRPAVLLAAAVPLAATAGTDGLVVGIAAAVAGVPLARLAQRHGPPVVPDVGTVTLAVLAPGLAVGAVVLLAELGPAAAFTAVVLLCAYDCGSFLLGAGASTRAEGPVGGALAVAVMTFAFWVLDLEPLGTRGALAVGAAVLAFAPLGPPMGLVLAGDADQPARFVRRLDSWLLAAPAAAWAAAVAVG